MKHRVVIHKKRDKKGGYSGDEMWKAHRLEGVVKNKAIKPLLKKKRSKRLPEII